MDEVWHIILPPLYSHPYFVCILFGMQFLLCITFLHIFKSVWFTYGYCCTLTYQTFVLHVPHQLLAAVQPRMASEPV